MSAAPRVPRTPFQERLLRAALTYAARGWAVVPVYEPLFDEATGVVTGCSCGKPACSAIGKHPRTRTGLKEGTTDPEKIAAYWGRWRSASVAICTGSVSGGLVLVDIDTKHGGLKNWEELRDSSPALPATPVVQTGGGGAHIYFSTPPGVLVKNSTSRIGPGIDVRGEGGYALAPPSLHASGDHYEGDLEAPLAELPAWLLERASTAKPSAPVAAGPLIEGKRNSALFKLGCDLREMGNGEAAIANALEEYNQGNCVPPLDRTEVGKIAQSSAKPPTRAGDRDRAIRDAINEPWGEPIPLANHPRPEFPLATFRPPLSTFVAELSRQTQTPQDMPAMLTLVALATAAGGKFVVNPVPGYFEPVNLFIAVAMEPGERKSEVFRLVTAPIRKHERERIAAWKRDEMARKAAAEEEAGNSEDDEQTPEPREFVDDSTPEKIAMRLAEQRGRLAILSAEGGELFELMSGRYSKDRPNIGIFLKGHAGDQHRVDRVGRPSLVINSPALTIGVATQPKTFRTLALKPEIRDRGLPARFLYSLPHSRLGSRDPTALPMQRDTREQFDHTLNQLFAVERIFNEDGRPNPLRIVLSEEARCLYLDYAQRTELRLSEHGDLRSMRDWGGKLVGATIRIAGLLHLADVPKDRLSQHAPPLSADALRRAIELAETYLVPHARAAFGIMADTLAIDGARRALDWLKRRKEHASQFSVRDLQRGIDSNGQRAELVDPAVEVLVSHGFIRLLEEDPLDRNPKGGKPRGKTYLICPEAR